MLTYRHTTAVNYDAEDDKTDHGDHLDNREDELGFAVTFFFFQVRGTTSNKIQGWNIARTFHTKEVDHCDCDEKDRDPHCRIYAT